MNQTGKVAVEYAKNLLENADHMVKMVQAYEKSQKTISIGSCAPGPLWEITPILSACYPEMTLSTEIKSHEQLLSGLWDETYHLIITAQPVDDPNVFHCKLCEEHLFLSLPPAHPLSQCKSVNLKDMAGETMLLMTNIGFWGHIHYSKMPHTKFILQNERFTFDQLVKVSALPSFTSNLVIKHEGDVPNRVTIPILDSDAKTTYYCICLADNKRKMADFFRAFKP